MRDLVCDPNVELIGYTARALLENLNAAQIKPFLDMHHLSEIDPEQWYPMQDVLDVLSDIMERGAATGTFVAIGMKAVETTVMPPELDDMTFEQFMEVYPEVFKELHRNGDVGSIEVDFITQNHLAIHLAVPYPDDVMYGVMFAYARRFLPEDALFTVTYDEDLPPRDLGGNETVIHITWED